MARPTSRPLAPKRVRQRRPWERRVTPGEMLSHNERTRFLRVPRKDWAKVMAGDKTEVRWSRKFEPADDLRLPNPMIAYSSRAGFGADNFRHGLVVCEAYWQEPLGSITEESLRRECQPDLAAFRLYWKARHQNARFDPLQRINVYRVRPWRGEEDETFFARQLIEWLYLEPIREGPLE